MKLIFRIAQNELRNLFYAPVAWLLTILFMILCAYYYTGAIYPMAKMADLVYRNFPDWSVRASESLTEAIYLGNDRLLGAVLQNIYLFVPLLTMNVINREINNGTIRLLFSSPVALRQIVAGKYLAIMIYNLLLVGIVAIFMLSGFFDIKSLDYGRLLSALLGFYLLLCALTAVGFFMSGLTTYPIVSAIASFTVLVILNNIGKLWQEYDFIRDLTWFLSIAGRTENMVLGLIATKDVVYYLLIIYLFIGFTLLKLKGGRQPKPWYLQSLGYLAIITSALLAGYVSALPRLNLIFDTTARNVNTIHPRTQAIIGKMDDAPLVVTLYANLLEENRYGFPGSRNAYLESMWEKYQRFKPDIRFNYEYYYDYDPLQDDSALYKQYPGKTLDQIAALIARIHHVPLSIFKTAGESRRFIDRRDGQYTLIMQLEYKGRSAFLRYFRDGWPNEQNVCAALKRLINAPVPKVAFVTGQLERNIYKRGEREFAMHTTLKANKEALINIGFDVDTVNLAIQSIPPDVDILVMADPKMELGATVTNKIRDYIDHGGNMLIFGEPGKQYVLNPLLQTAGVQLMPGQLVQPSPNETLEKVTPGITPAGLDLAEDYRLLRFKHFRQHHITDDSLVILSPGVTGLSATGDSGFTIRPIAVTSPANTWLKAGNLVVDSVAPVFRPEDGDLRAVFSTTLQLTRRVNNKEQRIILSGDADQISNTRFTYWKAIPLYSWLCYNQFPVYTPIPYAKDNMMTISPQRASAEKIIFVWVLPGITTLWGFIFLVRRNRK